MNLRICFLASLTAGLFLSVDAQEAPRIPASPPNAPRTDLHISGIYPHLTAYGIYSQNGAHYKGGHDECGIGAVVPWAGKLWMVTYAPHQPRGSEHKLHAISPDLKSMTIMPESVGGTPAGRMIHAESNQLLIAHYLVDAAGKVRTISPADMPIRVTAIARHLSDPANMVYYIDMEGSIWEANVHTLAVKQLFKKPVPGWHGKGGYTAQGRLVISNNGELHVGNYNDLLVGAAAKSEEEAGVLAQWDGTEWQIIERRQFTEVTGPLGITGGSDGAEPLWAIGWDRKSLRLKLLEDGKWFTYLLPKAALCNDARHGWYTEWPRIREITDGRWMMDMHGMFFDFPKSFSTQNSSGLTPISSHLRYIPDFCQWNGQLILASDETSIQGNKLAGQPQTNLWFGKYEDLKSWGPANGYGGPWIEDAVSADTPSDPFLVAGFQRRVLHLAVGTKRSAEKLSLLRTSDQLPIRSLSPALEKLLHVTTQRGNWRQPAAGFSFTVNAPVTVYLAVDQRGNPRFDNDWKKTDLSLTWGNDLTDAVYAKDFPAGTIEIPGNDFEHIPGSFGMPHMAFVSSEDDGLEVQGNDLAKVSVLQAVAKPAPNDQPPVLFTVQIDKEGNGVWKDDRSIEVPEDAYVATVLPDDFDATWIRLKTNRDCVATAFLHQTSRQYVDGSLPENVSLFAGLAEADADAGDVRAALLYPAKHNRNLQVIAPDDRHFEFTKAEFEFTPAKPDPALATLLEVEPEFTVDEASVILKHRGVNLRLPKGHAAFDQAFASGLPRSTREVQSERHLANIHGTFYEVPLINNGAPPAFDLMRPVASHAKQITDYCSWNGLLVLAGVRADAVADGHVFADASQRVALWFGGVDDLWKLGKPVGRGGPWLNTKVQAAVPSDPYLMTGFDRKKLTLSSDQATKVTIEVDFDHLSGWHAYRTMELSADTPLHFEFPEQFSAHWVRFLAESDCKATAQFVYE